MDVPVPQILEEIVALVACRRQATARVDVHASQADCAWPGGEWPLPPEGTAGGCRALRRRSVDITAGGPTGVHNLCKTHATISSLRPFFRRFLLISLLCCLFCSVSQATRILSARSASRWSIGDEQGQIILRFLAPRVLFNGAHFHSPQVRGFPRLLHCEQFCTVLSLTFAADSGSSYH